MRLIIAAAFAVLLLVPAAAAPRDNNAPTVTAQPQEPFDLSSAKRKKAKRKTVKQEQYLRAVPSTPPRGTKM